MINHSFVAIAVLMSVMILGGCMSPFNSDVMGSGVITTLEKDISGFSKIELSHSCRATIDRGDTYRVEIKVDDNIAEYLVAEKSGKTLRISLDRGHQYRNITLAARITLPDLEAVKMSGASAARLKGFSFKHPFKCKLSGSSRLSGSMRTGDVQYVSSGASRLTLSGEGEDLKIKASGASAIDLSRFVSNNAEVQVSGASQVTVNLSGRLAGKLSGSSKLYYHGNPVLDNLSTSGASVVRRKK
jgi:hypothetical protein